MFERAFAREILASECIRVRALAVTLGVLLVVFQVLLFVFDAVAAALGHDPGAATPLGEMPIRGYEGP